MDQTLLREVLVYLRSHRNHTRSIHGSGKMGEVFIERLNHTKEICYRSHSLNVEEWKANLLTWKAYILKKLSLSTKEKRITHSFNDCFWLRNLINHQANLVDSILLHFSIKSKIFLICPRSVSVSSLCSKKRILFYRTVFAYCPISVLAVAF